MAAGPGRPLGRWDRPQLWKLSLLCQAEGENLASGAPDLVITEGRRGKVDCPSDLTFRALADTQVARAERPTLEV